MKFFSLRFVGFITPKFGYVVMDIYHNQYQTLWFILTNILSKDRHIKAKRNKLE